MISISTDILDNITPQLVTSVVAAKKGESDLSLGNAIGSNIFNILLVLGASSAVHPIAVNPFTIYDTIFLVASSIIVYLFAVQKKELERREGMMMIPLYVIFFLYIVLR